MSTEYPHSDDYDGIVYEAGEAPCAADWRYIPWDAWAEDGLTLRRDVRQSEFIDRGVAAIGEKLR